jgi:hypothetical protein
MSKEITTTTYELPDFLVEANDMFSSEHPINKALLHVKSLNAQCYALKVLAPFDEIPELMGLDIDVAKDGYLSLAGHTLDGDVGDIEGDLEGYLEDINDARDEELLTFIKKIFDEEITRDNVHDQISDAYSKYCQGANWKDVFARRQVFLEARKLAESTQPTTSIPTSKPRI